MTRGKSAAGTSARRCCWGHWWSFCVCALAALQGVEDASCAGLKYLLLGAINKCLHNANDAVQVGETVSSL